MNLPTQLTLSRIVAVPILIGLLWWPTQLNSAIAFILYTLVGITDFFDGWLARRWNQTSRLGAFLDPIADKIMVVAVLVMLVALGAISGVHVLAALAILLREIMVSGLREFLAGDQVSMPVSKLAKWKTTAQMVALGALILKGALITTAAVTMLWIGIAALWIAAILTVVTGWSYLRIGLRHMR